MLNDTFPLRVEAIPAAHASEWRADDSFPPSETQAWQLVFVRSGTIEERCDARHVLLRAGGLLFHQPGEVFAMTTVGEVPPETLRIDFYCTGAAMDRFRGAMLHTEPAEQHDLNWLANAANELFDAAPVPGGRPVLKEELPFGAMQQFIIHLENLLILLARRCRRTKRPVARVRRERRQNALVEDARAYFAENLVHELKIDDICTALGCTRSQLQQAFRARLHRTAMEEFSAMRIEYAAQLLARGASPARSPRRWATAPARISAKNSALPRGTRRPPTAAFSRGCPPGGKTGNKKANQNQKLLLQKLRRKSRIQAKRGEPPGSHATISYNIRRRLLWQFWLAVAPATSAATPVWNFWPQGTTSL